MPQEQPNPAEGWTSGAKLAIPPQHLETVEIDAFLEFLFGDIAYRLAKLTLRESASVVRYLRILAKRGVPTQIANGGQEQVDKYMSSLTDEERRRGWIAEKAAEIIWGELRNSGSISRCGKRRALQFLRIHVKGYMNFYAEAILKFVEDFDLPPNTDDPFSHGPGFRSRSRSTQGGGNPYLHDDLSERICAAHCALRREATEKSRWRIAKALEKAGVEPSRRRKNPGAGWAEDNVNDRIKQFEKQHRTNIRNLLRSEGQPVTKERVEEFLESWRDGLADEWISSFRWKLICEQDTQPFWGLLEPVVYAIKRRRDKLRGLASIGNTSDSLVATAAQVASEKADEYDLLLGELERNLSRLYVT